MGSYRYFVGYTDFHPVQYNEKTLDEWGQFYVQKFSDKVIPTKTLWEAEKYLEMLIEGDCKFAFIFDKAKKEIIQTIKFL